jgi:Holliday junction resolvase RusA-like endonuclease
MNSISLTIPGPPRGKGRPRFARRGAGVTTYTDAQTAAYENLVALAYKAAGGDFHETGTAIVVVHAMYQIPKSVSKKKRAQMTAWEIHPQTKPDLDNVIKAVLDGLNGVAFRDDAQVTKLIAEKLYDERPRLDVEIYFEDAV